MLYLGLNGKPCPADSLRCLLRTDCHAEAVQAPVQALGPHVAALGMRFWYGEIPQNP